ncbi:MAG: alpha-ketoglutarate-dependent dioxygenase AlkB [Brevundimonas sp.]|nr:MAG: alpha-ketoglutarate-dependent dioxygenase AlkB [Brevundimonas sp.]
MARAATSLPARQADLFAAAASTGTPPGPPGLIYQDEVLSPSLADATAARMADLPFEAFDFQGYKGFRRIVSYGWRYDFSAGRLSEADAMPAWLMSLRDLAAAFGGLEAPALAQALVTEYAPGAGIGWHRDRPQFDKVIGLSLLEPCVLRFRRRRADGFDRMSAPLRPGSAYLLDGPARTEWEHSIVPMERLRYSITFRSFRTSD